MFLCDTMNQKECDQHMAKEVLTIRLERTDIDLLKAMAEKNVRTVASQVAFLIRTAAQEQNIKLQNTDA